MAAPPGIAHPNHNLESTYVGEYDPNDESLNTQTFHTQQE